MNVTFRLKYAWNTLKNNRLCSVISITGLALGLACVLVIAKQIRQEITTDRFHMNADRIYALSECASEGDHPSLTGYFTVNTLYRDYPAIEEAANIRVYQEAEVFQDSRMYRTDVIAVDSTFGKIFSFPMAAGNITTALSHPANAVITESFARKIYGQRQPLGENLTYWGRNYTIAAIVKDPPVNSSFTFGLMVPTREEFYTRMPSTWLLLQEGYDPANLQLKKGMELQKFTDLYFNESVYRGMMPLLRTGNLHTLWVLGWIGAAIFVISLFNYLHIYHVTLLLRNRELGVKKVFGNNNARLYTDFLYENFLIILLSIALALFLIWLFSGFILQQVGITLVTDYREDAVFLFIILLSLPLLLSIWPWYKYRHINPSASIRQGYTAPSSSWIRRTLLMAQYVMTTLMIVVSLYFIRQLHFMLNQDIGLHRENIVAVRLFRSPRYMIENSNSDETYVNFMTKWRQDQQYVKDRLANNPNIPHFCFGKFPMHPWETEWRKPDRSTEYTSCATLSVNPAFLPIFGIRIKEGRFFEAGKDANYCPKVVLNEAAKKFFHFTTLEGATLENPSWGKYEVIGVTDNFRTQHLAYDTKPLIMVYFENNEDPLLMNIVPGKEAETLDFLHKVHDNVSAGSDFTYRFFDDALQMQYLNDRHTVKTFSIFTILALFISTMGLFGFSVFDMQQRYREIAIRKVNGATRSSVIWRLTRRFCVLIFLSFLIACPIAWLVIHRYMEHFSSVATLPVWLFFVAMAITALITVFTLFTQSYRAASENPVVALKNE